MADVNIESSTGLVGVLVMDQKHLKFVADQLDQSIMPVVIIGLLQRSLERPIFAIAGKFPVIIRRCHGSKPRCLERSRTMIDQMATRFSPQSAPLFHRRFFFSLSLPCYILNDSRRQFASRKVGGKGIQKREQKLAPDLAHFGRKAKIPPMPMHPIHCCSTPSSSFPFFLFFIIIVSYDINQQLFF